MHIVISSLKSRFVPLGLKILLGCVIKKQKGVIG